MNLRADDQFPSKLEEYVRRIYTMLEPDGRYYEYLNFRIFDADDPETMICRISFRNSTTYSFQATDNLEEMNRGFVYTAAVYTEKMREFYPMIENVLENSEFFISHEESES